MPPSIDHVIVLMLENRSFDHMLGWSGLTGVDAATGAPTTVDGLTGAETNPLPGGQVVHVERGAPYGLDVDPGHEFSSVLTQLAGAGSSLGPDGAYPAVDNSGFATGFAQDFPDAVARDGVVPMKAFTPDQLPVLTALAAEFAVCDRWFCSMPGPTWPNRFFVHAASSAGLDDSPPASRTVTAIADGYRFANGTVFDRVEQSGRRWYVVEGDAFPQALAIHGMLGNTLSNHFLSFDSFKSRLGRPGFDGAYTFIEPSYGHVLSDGSNFRGGNSQHPQDDVTRGEALIKEVYETLRGSEYWERSLLIITYDEHGGFYDHVPPPAGVVPGDVWTDPASNRHGFRFDQLGVRVPAVVVSPFIPRGTIDHAVHDHAAVSATLRELWGTAPLTERDRAAVGVTRLASLPAARTDAPRVLPNPAVSGIDDSDIPLAQEISGDLLQIPALLSGRPEAALIGFLQLAVVREVHLAARAVGSVDVALATVRDSLEQRVGDVSNTFHLARFVGDVERRYQAARAPAGSRR